MTAATAARTAATRRDAVRGTFAALAAAAGVLTLPPNRNPMPTGEFVDITRAFREAEIEFDRLDSQFPRPPEGSAEAAAFERACVEVEYRRFELHDSVFDRRPKTLADVAVVAGHAISTLDCTLGCDLEYCLSSGDMEATLANMQRVFAGILAVVGPLAGIDPRDIGWRDMHDLHVRALADLEA